ncbi:hypothetical protein MYX65_13085 [Acidobacteria bacterium AH-259-L09]|nr:hypothetical protein [Acidobacteria bacterium AH-259-L09]
METPILVKGLKPANSYLALVLLAGISCMGEIPSEYRAFFDLPLSQQHRAIHDYPLDKQLDIYLIAVTRIHPPDYAFADDIASSGKKATPILVKRLKGEQDESIQQKIIYIFEVMARCHNFNVQHDLYLDYDVGNDKDVITLVKQVVSLMEGPFYKERSERSLKVILGGKE